MIRAWTTARTRPAQQSRVCSKQGRGQRPNANARKGLRPTFAGLFSDEASPDLKHVFSHATAPWPTHKNRSRAKHCPLTESLGLVSPPPQHFLKGSGAPTRARASVNSVRAIRNAFALCCPGVGVTPAGTQKLELAPPYGWGCDEGSNCRFPVPPLG